MVQAVRRRPLNAESRVRFKDSSCEICGGQTNTGTGVSHFCLRFALARTKEGKLETFQKQCCFGNRGELDIKVHSPSLNGLMVPKAYSDPWALLRFRNLYLLCRIRSSHGYSTQWFLVRSAMCSGVPTEWGCLSLLQHLPWLCRQK